MKTAWQYIVSFIFIIQMYLMMAVLAIYYAPLAVFRRQSAYDGVHTYCRWVRWTASWMVGLKSEVRGDIPTGEVLIASKHQSFFDIILIVSVVPEPKFIMKKELRWAPILGWFGKRIGCVPVDRGKKAAAIQQMVAGVRDPEAPPGQLIIYPQGTRVAPGVARAYKSGVGALYIALEQPCYPAATNVGVFWPRHGILRKPGLAVVEFLPVIAPGLALPEFMSRLEDDVETASNRLMEDAGFVAS
ncbi:MAG: 1-acyl-sn-glycerol-3-phosphate acyltransferase [Dinoroseobacter sp.]|nr:1-acyl-sn-glycerol-3-phosphate acyltransferase [Dinoroseobacter sp.]